MWAYESNKTYAKDILYQLVFDSFKDQLNTLFFSSCAFSFFCSINSCFTFAAFIEKRTIFVAIMYRAVQMHARTTLLLLLFSLVE